MLDAAARRLIDPPLDLLGRALADRGVRPNAVTLLGLGFGLTSALLISLNWFAAALVFLLLSRFADGLDGAVARASHTTDFGGYLDITSDFFFYGAVPFAFVLSDPSANGISGAFLLTAFYVNGASFLGYSVLAEKRGMKTTEQGVKSLYYSNGVLEGTETILVFVAMCLWPAAFPLLAYVFGALCFLTAGLRVWGARQIFRN